MYRSGTDYLASGEGEFTKFIEEIRLVHSWRLRVVLQHVLRRPGKPVHERASRRAALGGPPCDSPQRRAPSSPPSPGSPPLRPPPGPTRRRGSSPSPASRTASTPAPSQACS